jgi:hypothetical protein
MSFDYKALTRREYHILKVMERPGPGNIFMAIEAVDSTALAHPEWNMDEIHSYDDWERESGRKNKRKKKG